MTGINKSNCVCYLKLIQQQHVCLAMIHKQFVVIEWKFLLRFYMYDLIYSARKVWQRKSHGTQKWFWLTSFGTPILSQQVIKTVLCELIHNRLFWVICVPINNIRILNGCWTNNTDPIIVIAALCSTWRRSLLRHYIQCSRGYGYVCSSDSCVNTATPY